MTKTVVPQTALLHEDHRAKINELLEQLKAKQLRNALRDQYYDNKRLVQAITDAVPPLYNRLGLVLGWSQAAVDLTVRRCVVERLVWADGDIDAAGGNELWRTNRLASEIPQALTSSLTHSVSFAVASDREGGGAYVHFYDARHMTALRDSQTRQLTHALAVNGADSKGRPTSLSLFMHGRTIDIERTGQLTWEVTGDSEHEYGMPVFPLVYRPRLSRPFGSSRITRPMMSIQDQAVRELVRLEGHMDVFSFPELWMLGADMSIFDEEAWKVRMGRLKGVPDDETLENPRVDIQQITASSPDPHLKALNAFAKLFAREASLPDTSLAITDFSNPTGADSYDAAQYDLISLAEAAVDGWSVDLAAVQGVALDIANGDPLGTHAGVENAWRDPRYVSRSAQADAGLKQLMAVPELATSEVGLELIGLEPQQISRFKAEQRNLRSQQMLTSLVNAAPPDRLEVAADGVTS